MGAGEAATVYEEVRQIGQLISVVCALLDPRHELRSLRETSPLVRQRHLRVIRLRQEILLVRRRMDLLLAAKALIIDMSLLSRSLPLAFLRTIVVDFLPYFYYFFDAIILWCFLGSNIT